MAQTTPYASSGPNFVVTAIHKQPCPFKDYLKNFNVMFYIYKTRKKRRHSPRAQMTRRASRSFGPFSVSFRHPLLSVLESAEMFVAAIFLWSTHSILLYNHSSLSIVYEET